MSSRSQIPCAASQSTRNRFGNARAATIRSKVFAEREAPSNTNADKSGISVVLSISKMARLIADAPNADATSSAVGVLGVWRGLEDSPGVSDVGRAGLEPATNGLPTDPSRWLPINTVFVCLPTDYVAH
jgi:hypothetical protein